MYEIAFLPPLEEFFYIDSTCGFLVVVDEWKRADISQEQKVAKMRFQQLSYR